jgi:hypothetical protein
VTENLDPLLKRLADGDLQKTGRHPLQLWLLPVHLRSHDKYYQDAIDSTRHEIEESWTQHGRLYASREEFDASDFVRNTWARASPYWWGIDDIVGYIDVRASLAERQLQATLFLTTKRPSRTLVNKKYVAKQKEVVAFGTHAANNELRAQLASAVRRIAENSALANREFDYLSWARVLDHTDLVGILRAEAEAVLIQLDRAGAT